MLTLLGCPDWVWKYPTAHVEPRILSRSTIPNYVIEALLSQRRRAACFNLSAIPRGSFPLFVLRLSECFTARAGSLVRNLLVTPT